MNKSNRTKKGSIAQRSGFATFRHRTGLQGFRGCKMVLQERFDWRYVFAMGVDQDQDDLVFPRLLTNSLKGLRYLSDCCDPEGGAGRAEVGLGLLSPPFFPVLCTPLIDQILLKVSDHHPWFRRYNAKAPEKGRARKSMATRPKDWLEQTRKDWADHANQALARAGIQERITGASLDQQYRDALESGDERAAKRLKDQVRGCTSARTTSPEPSAGWMERTATAQTVEDGNQELKRDREDVEKMEGMLWRAQALAVQVAKQLADYVRARLERSRGRDGPDHGWSR